MPELVSKVQRKICLDGLTGLVLKTPVRTGRARGNWQVGISQRPTAVLEVPLIKPGKEPLPSPPPLAVAGQQAVELGSDVIKEMPPFCVCYITNNVEYILKLEDGGSRQSPHGMLVLTFEELTEMFR